MITKRSLDEYVAILRTIADTLGATIPVDQIATDDLASLRTVLIAKKKKGGKIAPSSQKRQLAMARSVFIHANEEFDANVKYKKPLKPPTGKQLRRARNEAGEKLFEPDEIKALLDAAPDTLKAMILLGINCGFGNRDCATLPIEQVDLTLGWHTYWRPKTEEPRRCPLWPETIEAIDQSIGDRKSGLVFATQQGNPWYSEEGRNCPISKEVRKLCIKLGIYRKNVTTFYTLRRTHYTIGSSAGEPAASSFIMGHTPASDDMSAVYRQKHFD